MAATFRRLLLVVIALVALTLAPTSALARGGGGGGGGGGRPEVRVGGTCGSGASSRLKLKSRDGVIEAEFEVHHRRSGSLFRVVLVREGRVAWRGRARTHGRSRSFEVSRRLSDFPGADRVMARAVGPRGVTCVAMATLPG